MASRCEADWPGAAHSAQAVGADIQHQSKPPKHRFRPFAALPARRHSASSASAFLPRCDISAITPVAARRGQRCAALISAHRVWLFTPRPPISPGRRPPLPAFIIGLNRMAYRIMLILASWHHGGRLGARRTSHDFHALNRRAYQPRRYFSSIACRAANRCRIAAHLLPGV